jgi:hypothetical protein
MVGALNPYSQDSTGCVSTTCYPGYTEEMCSPNLPLNAVEQIRDALSTSRRRLWFM